MECYNVTGEPDDDESLDISIPESEGIHIVEGVGISNEKSLSPLNIKKVNISSFENTNFSNIRDYWDDDNVGNITDLLHGFQDMFPTNFSKMKGIVGDLNEMKIPLSPNAKTVKQ